MKPILLLLASAALAFAQLGETLPQLTERYGVGTGKSGTRFKKGGIDIFALLDKDGKAKMVTFSRQSETSNDGMAHLTKQEVESFLKDNGKGWKLVDGKTNEWRTKDGKAAAGYQNKMLTIDALK